MDDIICIFEENVHALTPIQRHKVIEWIKVYASDVIVLAIEEAVNNNVRNIKYIDKILRVWSEKGLITVEDIKKYMVRWRNSKERGEENKELRYDLEEIERKLLGWDVDENLCNEEES